MVVTLYSQPGCCLCDQARAMLERICSELGAQLVEQDITTDDQLHRRYLERIPVVAVGGQEVLDLDFDEQEARRVLERWLEYSRYE